MRTAVALAALALGAAHAAFAEEATPLELDVGGAVNVCSAGLATCPVRTSLCDDPKIATVELGAGGAELKGISPGTTLCSFQGSSGFRRLYRVTVKAPSGPPDTSRDSRRP